MAICDKRLQLMEELCQKLPEDDAVQQTLKTARNDFSELQEEVESTHQKLMQHPDKWKEYNARCNLSLHLKISMIKKLLQCLIRFLTHIILFESFNAPIIEMSLCVR